MHLFRSMIPSCTILLAASLALSGCGQKQPASLTESQTQTPIPLAAIATVTPIPILTPYPKVSPTNKASPSPVPQSQTWGFDSTCGAAPIINVYPKENGEWSLLAWDKGKSKIVWDFSQEKIASRFRWHSIQYFHRFEESNRIAFLGTDQDNKTWLGQILSRCDRGVSFEVLLPIEDPNAAFLEAFWIEKQGWEYWLVDGEKLTVYKAKDQIGQAIWEMNGVLFSAVTVKLFGDINHDGKPERLLNWWEWHGNFERDYMNTRLTQIFREDAQGFALIGEIDGRWLWIDMESDGKVEFLKSVPSAPAEKWDVYAYLNDTYSWSGQLTLFPPPAAVPVTVEQLPPLPNDLYFKQDDQGWIWPKAGGKLQSVKVRAPEKKLSPCSGEKANDQILWSSNCRYVVGSKPGSIEGSSSVVYDRPMKKEIDIPNSFIYSQGFSTFAWDPQSQYLIHARADGGDGLYRIDFPSGKVTTLVPFSSNSDPLAHGAAYPYILKDGSIVFLIQGTRADVYPPLGIYRRMPDGELRRLAALSPGKTYAGGDLFFYGELFPVSGGSAFLFGERNDYYLTPSYLSMLLVDAEGKNVWDVTSVLGQASDFRWLP